MNRRNFLAGMVALPLAPLAKMLPAPLHPTVQLAKRACAGPVVGIAMHGEYAGQVLTALSSGKGWDFQETWGES